MKSTFKDSLIGGVSVGLTVLLTEPALKALSLPNDGWQRYAVPFGFLMVSNGAWDLLFKRK
jgi:hypothetical protein